MLTGSTEYVSRENLDDMKSINPKFIVNHTSVDFADIINNGAINETVLGPRFDG
jgi:hypothetical protein